MSTAIEFEIVDDTEIAYERELTTPEEIRALADPLRQTLRIMLAEREMTVQEISKVLNVPRHGLYYHVKELERAGLVRLVRTEVISGIANKYYRATSRTVIVPFELLHHDPSGELAREGVLHKVGTIEQVARVLRYVLMEKIDQTDPEVLRVERRFLTLTQEKARQLARMVDDFFAEMEREQMSDTDVVDDPLNVIILSAVIPCERNVLVATPVNDSLGRGRTPRKRRSGAPATGGTG